MNIFKRQQTFTRFFKAFQASEALLSCCKLSQAAAGTGQQPQAPSGIVKVPQASLNCRKFCKDTASLPKVA